MLLGLAHFPISVASTPCGDYGKQVGMHCVCLSLAACSGSKCEEAAHVSGFLHGSDNRCTDCDCVPKAKQYFRVGHEGPTSAPCTHKAKARHQFDGFMDCSAAQRAAAASKGPTPQGKSFKAQDGEDKWILGEFFWGQREEPDLCRDWWI